MEQEMPRVGQKVRWMEPLPESPINVGVLEQIADEWDIRVDQRAIAVAFEKLGIKPDEKINLVFTDSRHLVESEERFNNLPNSLQGPAFRLFQSIGQLFTGMHSKGYADFGQRVTAINLDLLTSSTFTEYNFLAKFLRFAINKYVGADEYLEMTRGTKRLAFVGFALLKTSNQLDDVGIIAGHEIGHVIRPPSFLKMGLENAKSTISSLSIGGVITFLASQMPSIQAAFENIPNDVKFERYFGLFVFAGLVSELLKIGYGFAVGINIKEERDADRFLDDLAKNGVLNDFVSAFSISPKTADVQKT